MGIANSIKGKMVDVVLKRLMDGDKGSSLLGLMAGALLAANIDFGRVFAFFQNPTQENCIEAAKALAVVIAVVWGYFIGRKPGAPKQNDQTPPGAALAH